MARLFRPGKLSLAVAPPDSAVEAEKISAMTIDITTLSPIVALVAGILVLIAPRILNYVVAVYPIVAGITGLLPHVTH
jgi:hypothetical protein